MNLKWGTKGIQVSLIVWFSFIRHFVFTFRGTIWYCIIYLTTFHFIRIPDHRVNKFIPLSILTSTSQPRYIYPNRLVACESIKRRFGISKNSSEAEQFHPSRYSLVPTLAELRTDHRTSPKPPFLESSWCTLTTIRELHSRCSYWCNNLEVITLRKTRRRKQRNTKADKREKEKVGLRFEKSWGDSIRLAGFRNTRTY